MKTILLDNFYSEISSSSQSDESFNMQVKLNASHPIYKGHFGHIPVAPGVCLIQMVKEIIAKKIRKDLVLTNGDNIKFLSMINPLETPELTINFNFRQQADIIDVSATFTSNNTTFVKFKGKFKLGNPAAFDA
jgi:3-hydroxyacyl-[acyl-carrier-protein] dehydratase